MNNKYPWKKIILCVGVVAVVVILFYCLVMNTNNNPKYVGFTTSTAIGGNLSTEITETSDEWKYSVDYDGDFVLIIDYVVKIDEHSYVFLCRIIDDNNETRYINQNVYVDNTTSSNGVQYVQVSETATTERENWVNYLKSINNFGDKSMNILIDILENME